MSGDYNPPCDNHPDRVATRVLGYDSVDGGQAPIFVVTKRFCDECIAEYKKHNITIERCP